MIEVRHEARYMRAAVDGGVPVLGLCYGGQLLAHALGGSVEPAPEPEFGWHELQLAGAAHTSGASGPIEPGPYLQWHVDRLTPPSGARVLARTPAAIQAFSIRGSLGLQFHPEATPEMVGQWVETGRAELDRARDRRRSAARREPSGRPRRRGRAHTDSSTRSSTARSTADCAPPVDHLEPRRRGRPRLSGSAPFETGEPAVSRAAPPGRRDRRTRRSARTGWPAAAHTNRM